MRRTIHRNDMAYYVYDMGAGNNCIIVIIMSIMT
jgi:hypothetical protein